jgi:hypothetical protein
MKRRTIKPLSINSNIKGAVTLAYLFGEKQIPPSSNIRGRLSDFEKRVLKARGII